MHDATKVLNFPSKAIQKNIPREQLMSKEIAKEHVSIELLQAKLEEAGYEAELKDGEISVQRTGCNLKITNYPEHASLRIFGIFLLKQGLAASDLDQFVASVSAKSFFVNFSGKQWEDGDSGIFGSYVIYYPFGLNLPNFIFSIRRLAEGMHAMYNENRLNEKYFSQNADQ